MLKQILRSTIYLLSLTIGLTQAANSQKTIQVICNEGPICKLPEKDKPIWNQACKAIIQNNNAQFSTNTVPRLIDKVADTGSSAHLQDFATVLEYLIKYPSTEQRTWMLEQLINQRANLDATYSVVETEQIDNEKYAHPMTHQVPIFYAIKHANLQAFKLLYDNKHDLELPWTLLNINETKDTTEKKIESLSIAHFIERLQERTQYTAPKEYGDALQKMYEYTQSSCRIS